MNKKYQVFVSSTFTDLQEEREAALEALLQLNCIPSGMELFPASNEDQWTLIKRVIDESDYYVVIVAGRYGSTDADGVGYTEKEYDYAVQSGKPVLGFVHADPTALPMKRCETDPKMTARLEAFRAKVKTRMCRFWNTSTELKGLVSTSLAQQIFLYPAEGWVRGRHAKTTEDLEKVNRMHEQIRTLETELERLRALAPAQTSHLAQGDDPVMLRYTIDTAKRTLQTTWNAVFRVVGSACLNIADESSITAALRDWAASQSGRPDDRLTVWAMQEIWQKSKTQFVCLGLIEPEMILQPVGTGQSRMEQVCVWKLTDQGRAVLGTLAAVLRDDARAQANAPATSL